MYRTDGCQVGWSHIGLRHGCLAKLHLLLLCTASTHWVRDSSNRIISHHVLRTGLPSSVCQFTARIRPIAITMAGASSIRAGVKKCKSKSSIGKACLLSQQLHACREKN